MNSFSAIFLVAVMACAAAVQPNAECQQPGVMCKNCDEVAVCVSYYGEMFTQTTAKKCSESGGSCRNGKCVTGAKCNYRDFTCTEAGFFPDPYDCTVVHYCDGNSTTPTAQACPGNNLPGTEKASAYDPAENVCGAQIIGNPYCSGSPVPRCNDVGTVGALQQNPNLYYICTEDSNSIGPLLFRCPTGKSFNETAFICE